MGFVDLHVHSDASDGTFTPTQVVELAKNAGLDAIALTDHDTTAGVDEALEAAHHL
ncbi:PHP domain-containing protein, partial [Enterocloster sp.]|uniref:PHP domain-containing protein n=1 Tax=Enterocloster sp. TaxID=2719315 RepID=UPI003A94861F